MIRHEYGNPIHFQRALPKNLVFPLGFTAVLCVMLRFSFTHFASADRSARRIATHALVLAFSVVALLAIGRTLGVE